VNFQEYLQSKKIDAASFSASEPSMFASWETEFGQMHPNSFTVQKLNLINPIRRRFPLTVTAAQAPASAEATTTTPASAPVATPPTTSKPVMRPMIRPKPKLS
jgi:hypothetical protein